MSEYLKKLEQEKNRLELSIKRSQLSNSSKERKERTRRLIQKGALLEKYFDCEDLTEEETEELLKIFSSYINDKKPEKFKRKRT
ncbi:hypothetical protein P8832_09610 [Bacillus subtilis]|uniref:hypothetical protein n=1 Tax=Bacillus subtilis TaxID=1423 RepID=UPI002DBF9E1A|nr:hypothetical protein [Bacillus subtilis]MEC0434416.1 hypothetical protein [Bacillus subtilis]